MAMTLGDIMVRFRADASDLQRGVATAQTSLSGLGRSAQESTGGIGGFFGKVVAGGQQLGLTVLGVKGLADGIQGAAQAAFAGNAQWETTVTAFTQLMGSAQNAQKYLKELWMFAKETPFEFPQVTKAAQMLISVGYNAKDVIPMLTGIGDAVSAFGGGAFEVERVTRAIMQMSAKGKISAEEMMQISEIGIPAWDILSKVMKKPTAELMEMSQKGKLVSKDMIPELVRGFERSFGGQMQNQAKTFTGTMSNLADTWGGLVNDTLLPAFEQAKVALQEFVKTLATPDFKAFAAMLAQGIGVALKGVMTVLGTVVTGIKEFIAGLRQGNPVMIAIAALLVGAVVGLVAFKVAALLSAGASVIMMHGLGGAALAALGLNAAMLPWLAIAAGAVAVIALLVLGFKLLWEKCEPFRKAVLAIKDALFSAFVTAWNTIRPALEAAWAWLQSSFATLKDIAGRALSGIWNGLVTAWNFVKPSLQAAWNTLTQFGNDIKTRLQPILAAVGGWFKTGFGNAQTALKPVIDWVTANWPKFVTVIQNGLQTVQRIWNAVWPSLVDALKNAWGLIQGVVKVAWDLVSGIIKIGLDILGGNWKKAWEDLKGMLGGVWEGIQQIVTNAIGMVGNIFGGMFKGVLTTIDQFTGGALGKMLGWKNDSAQVALQQKAQQEQIALQKKEAVLRHQVLEGQQQIATLNTTKARLVDQYKNAKTDAEREAIAKQIAVVDKQIKEKEQQVAHAQAQRQRVVSEMQVSRTKTLAEMDQLKQQQAQKNPSILDTFTKPFRDFFGGIPGTFKGIKDRVVSGWNGVISWVQSTYNTIKGALEKPWNAFKDGIGGIMKTVGDRIKSAIHTFILDPLQNFVRAIGTGINKVGDLFGKGNLSNGLNNWSHPGLAKGTQQWGGGVAMVGEEGPELVYLPPGVAVMPAGPTAAVVAARQATGQAAIPGFAGGIGDWLGMLGAAGTEILRKIFDLGGASLKMPGVFVDVAGKIVEFLIKAGAGWAKDLLGKLLPTILGSGNVGTANVPGSVTEWIRAAIAITGVPLGWLSALTTIAMRESAGNPNAINLWDINAIRGIPSKGLFQTIDPTFNAYAYPGMNNIWNPIHNAAAAIRYILARYGSVFNVPGIVALSQGRGYVGYADGGWITEPILGVGASGTRYRFGEVGPEYVSPAGGGRGGPVTFELYIDSRYVGKAVAPYIKDRTRLAVGRAS